MAVEGQGPDCDATSNGELGETTPLLRQGGLLDEHGSHDLVYQRFSPLQKRQIVTMVSFCGVIPLFIGGSFIPSLPQIAKDLDTTLTKASMVVSISILGISIGALTASGYSTYYGRRPIYLIYFPLFILGSFAVATSSTISELVAWRFVQAIGTSPGVSVGAGVIGDIYKLEERGGAMGIFFACILVGPTIAPFVGGFAAHYSSWRMLQAGIATAGLVVFMLVYAFLPETSHPGERGVDKVPESKPGTVDLEHRGWVGKVRNRLPVLLNPLAPLWLLRSPNLFLVCFGNILVSHTIYVLLVPISVTLGEKFGISNEAIVGACFLPSGLGNMIGAPIAGRLSDYLVVRYRARRGGIWYPEDRLRATPYAFLLVPGSMFLSGFVTGTKYIENRTLGLSIYLFCLFVNGLGIDIVGSPSAAYFVDVMQKRSAESMAANSSTRQVIQSVMVAGIMPMAQTYGILVTDVASGVLSAVGFVLIWATIRYGERLREWGAVEDLTDENHSTL